MSRVGTAAIVVIALLITAPRLSAQGRDYLAAHYDKHEYQIPMRDGAKLFTAVYTPKDHSQTYPLLLFRTQSGIPPYGADQFPANLGPSAHFPREKYIFVTQDIRGRWMSEGEFVVLRPQITPKTTPRDVDESTDTYDTIDWLLKSTPQHNGRVGLYGTSYRGWLAAAGMIDAHPALKAVSPQAPVGDTFVGDDWHHNGAFFLNHTFFYAPRKGHRRSGPSSMPPPIRDYGTNDAYDFFLRLGSVANAETRYFRGEVPYWTEVLRHPNYDDFWKRTVLLPHLRNIRPAVLIVGGWYDCEDLYGTLATYHEIERHNPGTTNTLVLGPWIHGGWNDSKTDGSRLGAVSFAQPTAEHFREQIEMRFFEYHLKGRGSFKPPEALVFETGANRWHELEQWPPAKTEPVIFYLQSQGKLATQPPTREDTQEFDEYLSDPAKPVPYTEQNAFRVIPEFMVADQRFAARRPDVLTYETEPLDVPLTLVGPLTAELHVSTSGTDADWIVKLIDVYPANTPDPEPNPAGVRLGNYQQLVRAEVMRGKYRNSLEHPEPFTPGAPTVVRFTLPDLYHTFQPGHRLMLQIQSSWFPLVDRNPQRFVDIYQARDTDFQSAVHRVYRSSTRASQIRGTRLP
ncbi:MAG: CocE/NonD family hydrolase [Planctomycetaceae bacterium]|nr:CocE/NonD family hydrolase [Planctomycetaceae bacterium]